MYSLCILYGWLGLQEQSWIVLTENIWMPKLKIFTAWPFMKKKVVNSWCRLLPWTPLNTIFISAMANIYWVKRTSLEACPLYSNSLPQEFVMLAFRQSICKQSLESGSLSRLKNEASLQRERGMWDFASLRKQYVGNHSCVGSSWLSCSWLESLTRPSCIFWPWIFRR